MVPSRAAHDVLGGMLHVLSSSVRCRAARCGIRRAASASGARASRSSPASSRRSAGRSAWARVLCAPNDPEAKGLVERANGYFETSFLPGRRFDDVDDFNRQLTGWLRRANNRIHGTTRQRPSEAIYEDRGSMMSFPPVLPDVSWRFATRLPRDHYVRVDTNDYSVNPRFVGRRIEVRVTLDEVDRDLRRHRSRPASSLPGEASDAAASRPRACAAGDARRAARRVRVRRRGRRTRPRRTTTGSPESRDGNAHRRKAEERPRVSVPCVEGTVAGTLGRAARRTRPRRRLDPRRVPRRVSRTRSRRPPRPRRRRPHPRRPVPGPQDARGLRLQLPTLPET